MLSGLVGPLLIKGVILLGAALYTDCAALEAARGGRPPAPVSGR